MVTTEIEELGQLEELVKSQLEENPDAMIDNGLWLCGNKYCLDTELSLLGSQLRALTGYVKMGCYPCNGRNMDCPSFFEATQEFIEVYRGNTRR